MKRTYSLIAIALLIGLFIYLFYRTEKTVVNELLMLFVSHDTFSEMRITITRAIPLNESIIYSLPGGLWVFCTTVLSRDLVIKFGDYKIPMVIIPILFAVGLEACQLIHLTNGTFDRWDIGFSVMFWLAAYYGFQSQGVHQNISVPFTRKAFIWLACFLSVYLAHVSA